MEREEYLGLVREGWLAFEQGDFMVAATKYAEAMSDFAAGEMAYSDHYGEYAAVLRKLGRMDEALAQSRLAVEAAMREYGGDPDASVVAMHSYFLGDQLIAMGRADEALRAVAPSLTTSSKWGAVLSMVQAEALAELGRWSEAKVAAAEATRRAPEGARTEIAERLSRVLK